MTERECVSGGCGAGGFASIRREGRIKKGGQLDILFPSPDMSEEPRRKAAGAWI